MRHSDYRLARKRFGSLALNRKTQVHHRRASPHLRVPGRLHSVRLLRAAMGAARQQRPAFDDACDCGNDSRQHPQENPMTTPTPPLPHSAPPPVAPATVCADCGTLLVRDGIVRDGWPMTDGRTTCFDCCNKDLAHFDWEKQSPSGGVDVTEAMGEHAAILERMFRERCADCGIEIGHNRSPRDMWEMEDGRTVCHKCAVAELRRFTEVMRLLKEIDGIIKAK